MARFDVDPDLIRRLAALLEETGLSEIEYAEGRRHVRVARPSGGHAAASHAAANPSVAPAVPAGPATGHAPPGAVASPMVGTVFLAPEPGAPAFVKLGDVVAEGQTLVIIEAMKVMNPIKAPRAGTVLEIRVANGTPVEFGEVLLVLG